MIVYFLREKKCILLSFHLIFSLWISLIFTLLFSFKKNEFHHFFLTCIRGENISIFRSLFFFQCFEAELDMLAFKSRISPYELDRASLLRSTNGRILFPKSYDIISTPQWVHNLINNELALWTVFIKVIKIFTQILTWRKPSKLGMFMLLVWIGS